MYNLIVYVPEPALIAVKEALFAAGAGALGQYDRCAWEVLGQGQFRPLLGSRPQLGTHGEDTQVAEYRVEMVVADEVILAVLDALRAAHPYEEPAYHVLRVFDYEGIKALTDSPKMDG